MKAPPKARTFVTTSAPRPVRPGVQVSAVVAPPRIVAKGSTAGRLVQRLPAGSRGLAIGYGFREDFPLPGWGLVLSSEAPSSGADLGAARRLAGVPAGTPLLLIGYGPGVKTVFCTFIANNCRDVVGAAFFGADYPTDAYSLSLWVALAERSAAKDGLRLLSDLKSPDKSLAAVLGTAQASTEAPKDEAPAGRIVRLLTEHYGPASAKLPAPVPPREHFTPPASE